MSEQRKIMVFYPTMEEFKNFKNYIEFMEYKGAHTRGIAKVVPPAEWIPRRRGYLEEDIMSMVIPHPIRQCSQGREGVYRLTNFEIKSMTVANFKELADSNKYRTPHSFDYTDLEKKYWQNVVREYPIYGADVNASVTDKDLKHWNLSNLGTILDNVKDYAGQIIEGVNTPYLYFGMWKSTFAYHVEDMNLYSINYIHYGSPKTWYAIPPEEGNRFYRFAEHYFPTEARKCSAFLNHKMAVISPYRLKESGIPFDTITQEKGEFIITFPFGFHAGFNHGFNIAEASNFASTRWIEYGKLAKRCRCYRNSVHFDMDIFNKPV